MHEMLKKESRKNALSSNNKSVNDLYIERYYCYNQQQNINEIQIKYKAVSGENNKDRSVVQMMLYNAMKKGASVRNLNDLNVYIKNILHAQINIKYDMFDAEQERVDAAIQELDPNEVDGCLEEENVRQVIQSKINKLIEQDATKKQRDEEKRKERIRALSLYLETLYTERKENGQDGFFVGKSEAWHIHFIHDRSVHLKYGSNNRSRKDIHMNSKDNIIEAVKALFSSQQIDNINSLGKDVRECYCWLRYTMIKWFDEDLPEEYQFEI